MSGFAGSDRLLRVRLEEDAPRARAPEIQQELEIALFDLSEENRLALVDPQAPPGPWTMGLGMVERMLRIRMATGDGTPALETQMSLAPLRGLIKDYFDICETYLDAVRRLPPSQIETIDAGRRALHDEGAGILEDRLADRIRTDRATARRLFTVICALNARS